MVSLSRHNQKAAPRLGRIVGLSLTVLMLLLAWVDPLLLTRFENVSLDMRFRLRGERPPDKDIVLVLIDDKSLQELGRWPWPRNLQAKLVTEVAAQGAKVIGLDIIYSEPEHDGAARALQEIIDDVNTTSENSRALIEIVERKLKATDPDIAFSRSLAEARNVVLGFPLFVQERASLAAALPTEAVVTDVIRRSEFMLVRQPIKDGAVQPFQAINVLSPLASFASQAAGLGHVYSPPDLDGTTRSEYLALRLRDSYYPSFALEVTRHFLGAARDRLSLSLGEGVRVADRLILTDVRSRMYINFIGREGRFLSVSAADVIQRRTESGAFKNKVVLVGTTALATYDQHVTPFSSNFPGVEKNATVIENILHERFIRKSIWFGPLELGMMLFFGLAVSFTLPRLRALPGTLWAAGAGLSYACVTAYAFAVHNLWLPLVGPLVNLTGAFAAVTILNFMTKERQAKEIRRIFSSYVNPQIVEQIIDSPDGCNLSGQRKQLTMLFADLINFTSFSEKHSAEEVVAQLNEYLTAMTEIVFYWDGTLDKFVGDQIVVFWGAPLDQADHAERAIKCALHMRKRLAELREKWAGEKKVLLDSGIGINTGAVVVGNIGAEGKKVDYTIIGDQVNLASRFQGLTRTFGVPIVLTEYTAEHLKSLMGAPDREDNRGRLGHVLLRRLGTVTVKGRAEPVEAYTVQSLKMGERSRIE